MSGSVDNDKIITNVHQLFNYRRKLIQVVRSVRNLGVNRAAIDVMEARIWRVNREIGKYLKPVHGLPQIIEYDGTLYTWVESGNFGESGLRTVKIEKDLAMLKTDRELHIDKDF